jgi:hypothetical protein
MAGHQVRPRIRIQGGILSNYTTGRTADHMGGDEHDPILASYIRQSLPLAHEARKRLADSDVPHAQREDAYFATVFALGWTQRTQASYVSSVEVHSKDLAQVRAMADTLTELCLQYQELQDLRDLRDEAAAYVALRRETMDAAARQALAVAFGAALARTAMDSSSPVDAEQAAHAVTEVSVLHPRLFQKYVLSLSGKVEMQCRCYSCVSSLTHSGGDIVSVAKEVMAVVRDKFEGRVSGAQVSFVGWLAAEIRRFMPYLAQQQVDGVSGDIEHSARMAHDFLQSLGRTRED